MKDDEDNNEGVSFLFVIQFFSFLLVIGGLIAAIMIGSISYSTKLSGAYEKYDAMVAELDALTLPEKTILNSTGKGIRSSWVYSSRGYRTNFSYYKLIPFYHQQFKLKGWSELGKKDDSNENEEAIIYSFKKQDWILEFMRFKGKKGKPNPYIPWSYAYKLKIEWER